MKRVRRNISGSRIRQRRRYEDLTQDEFVEILQMRGLQILRDGISKIENGERSITDYELNEIAQTLNVDIYWLLGITNEPGKYGKISSSITNNYLYKINKEATL